MIISELFDDIKRAARLTRAENTARTYTSAIKRFETYLLESGINLEADHTKITINDFVDYPVWLLNKNYSRKSVYAYVAGVKFLLEQMITKDMINPSYNESIKIKLSFQQVFKKRESGFVRTPKKDDVDKIIKAVRLMEKPAPIRERDIAIVEIFVSSGCRNNEIANLKISDIDIEDRSAVVTGKGSKKRRVFFSESAANALVNYWNVRGNRQQNSYAFLAHDKAIKGRDLKHLTTAGIRYIIRNITHAAGIEKGKFTPHYFRHAFAIKMLRETGNIALVQDLMGHASSDSTRIYAKIYPDELAEQYRSVFK